MSFTTSSQQSSSHLSLGASDFSRSFTGTAIPPPAPAPASVVRSSAPTTQPGAQESKVSNKPFIRRKPVQAVREPTPPRSSSIPRSPTLYGSRGNSPAGIGGPLSSHPITPVDSENIEAFPLPPVQRVMAEPLVNGKGNSNGIKSATNGPHQPHISGDSSDSNNFDPSLPQQPINDTSRRPSFVSRFMRIRSGSFMRSKSQLGKGDSATSLNQKENGNGNAAPSFIARSERGLKRPGSPMVSRSATSSGPAQSNTFPRMVRKKSMELLSTARRKSGMFGREDDMTQSAIDEERAREQAREEYMRPHDQVMRDADDRQSEEIWQREEQRQAENQRRYEELRKRDPAPTIQLNGLSALDGDDMFKDIGR